MKKLNSKSLGLSLGLLAALAVLALSFYPSFSEPLFGVVKGQMMVDFLVDSYPWYNPATFWGVIAGMAVAFVDAFIFAFLVSSLYNHFSKK